MRLLLLEHNPDLAAAIIHRMRRIGHAVDWQSGSQTARRVLGYERFDLIILNSRQGSLPLLTHLRHCGDTTPVLILTARKDIDARVDALNAGADDCLDTPFDFREFEARCRVLLRRRHDQPGAEIKIGGFTFDDTAHRVSLDGEPIDLPNREYRLLEILLRRLGQVVGKDELGNGLFGFDADVGPNAIELYIARLRRKLKQAPLTITTVRGVGYLMEEARNACTFKRHHQTPITLSSGRARTL